MATEIYLGYPPARIVQWIKDHSVQPAPAAHEETWYKYDGDNEWRTVMLGGTIQLKDSDSGEEPTGQINDPHNIVAIEIGTGTQANPVTSIGNWAFGYCSGLMSVTIPDSVTSIGENAFSYCDGLTSVTIPDSVTSIGESAFDGCSSLTSVTVPADVTSIGCAAFINCEGLESVTIGSGIQRIGHVAFQTLGSPITLTIDKTVSEVEAMGQTDYDHITNTTYSEWGLPSGSTIVCTNGTITIE